MHVSVSKCGCFDLRTGTGIILILGLIDSIGMIIFGAFGISYFPVSFGFVAWAIFDIAIYGIGCIAFFKEKPKLLIPSIVWMIVEPILGTIYAVSTGKYDDIFNRLKAVTTEWLYISICVIYVTNLIVFVLSTLMALVVWSYYKSKIGQENLNAYRNRLQNPQAQVDLNVCVDEK